MERGVEFTGIYATGPFNVPREKVIAALGGKQPKKVMLQVVGEAGLEVAA